MDLGVFAVAIAVAVGWAKSALLVVTVAEFREAVELLQVIPSPIA